MCPTIAVTLPGVPVRFPHTVANFRLGYVGGASSSREEPLTCVTSLQFTFLLIQDNIVGVFVNVTFKTVFINNISNDKYVLTMFCALFATSSNLKLSLF